MALITNQTLFNSSSSSSSSFTRSWTHDVFLSFRGEDTRTNFIDHLYNALIRKGITTFIDNELSRGDKISTALLQAIEESRISIVVFSKNYASSRWCLDELVHILQCKESKQQMVRPVFYNVDPSHVRNQTKTSSFGDAFADHECKYKGNMDKVLKWRVALNEAANLSGWCFKEGEYESKFINDIVEEISIKLLNRTYLNVPEYLVGIESCVQDVDELLGVGGNGCCMVGIWGTAGIGKTTIAKSVYNSIAHKFESSCFLGDVGENSMEHGGLTQLQETLLGEILGGKSWKVVTVDKGISVIRQRLSHKKVLLILDDVNQLDQLNNLAGAVDWFGEGSRVIITTKNRELLTRHGIELIYEVKKLDEQKALELFSMIVFKRNEPPYDYLELSRRAIDYAQHLPLALTLLGSHLRNESIDRWRATLDYYEAGPYPDIQKILRISYDALTYRVQQVFLDIACFFKGEDKDYVIQVLRSRNLKFPEECIQTLLQNALITIEDNKILIHDLLKQMGKDIVYEESPTEPGERSRLWFHDDVEHVLTENTGTTKIKGIMVNLPKQDEIHLNAESFSQMKNLEFFINRNARFSGDIDYLSNKLRLIDWDGYHLQDLPSNFRPKELVVFKMPRSRIIQLGEVLKNLKMLTSLDLRDCSFLTRIPDLSGIPNIEYLNLRGCTSLVEVDDSVGFLDKLMELHLMGCYNLRVFPTRIRLKSLRKFILTDCTRLETFPEMDKMESIRNLELDRCGIRELPSSIAYLTGLERLFALGCENLTNISFSRFGNNKVNFEGSSSARSNSSISHYNRNPLVFPKLQTFGIGGCNLSETDFLASLDCLSTLTSLNLSGNNFVSLPIGISKFVKLRSLCLYDCKRLREIPRLPPKLRDVWVDNCKALEMFPKLSSLFQHNESQGLERISLTNCNTVCANHGCHVAKMEILLLNQVSSHQSFQITLPGNEVPNWFSCRKNLNFISESPTPTDIINLSPKHFDICELTIEIPRDLEWEKSGLAVCVAYEIFKQSNMNDKEVLAFGVKISINGEKRYNTPIRIYPSETKSTHVWLKYIPLYNKHKHNPHVIDGVLCMFQVALYLNLRSSRSVLVKSCGVHLICNQVQVGDAVGAANDSDDVDQHEQEQNPQEKMPPGSSVVLMEVDDIDTNDVVDGSEQCLSLSLVPTNPRKRKHTEEQQPSTDHTDMI